MERHNNMTILEAFELGVRTLGGLFFGVWYVRGIDFRRNFWPTRSDEDV